MSRKSKRKQQKTKSPHIGKWLKSNKIRKIRKQDYEPIKFE